MTGRVLIAMLVAGALADALAARDRDVENGIAAYDAADYETALARFDAAIARRGDRPELAFDRGLVLLAREERDDARAAFERGSESEDPLVRASAFYELGCLALDAEDYEAAIEHFTAALRARPDHTNAKWNLELALQRKQDRDEQDEQDEQDQDEQDQDEQDQDEQDEQDEQDPDEQDQDEQDEQDEQDPDEQDEQDQDEQDQDEQNQDEQDPDEQNQDPQDADDPRQDEQQQQAEPRALDAMDVQKALDQLDEQDDFSLDRPVGGYVAPQKDW